MLLYDNLIVGSDGYIGSRLSNELRLENNLLISSRRELFEFIGNGNPTNFKRVLWVAGSHLPADSFTFQIDKHPDFVSLLRFLESTESHMYRLIYISSGGCVYGPGSGTFSEESGTSPVNFYGELKLLSERLIQDKMTDYSILRVSNVFGVGQKPNRSQGVITHWIDAIRGNRPLIVYGSTSAYRDYINIESLLEAILLSSHSSLTGIFNIGSNTPINLDSMIKIFEGAIGKQLLVHYLPARYSDRQGYTLKTLKAESQLGWRRPENTVKLIELVIKEELTLL